MCAFPKNAKAANVAEELEQNEAPCFKNGAHGSGEDGNLKAFSAFNLKTTTITTRDMTIAAATKNNAGTSHAKRNSATMRSRQSQIRTTTNQRVANANTAHKTPN